MIFSTDSIVGDNYNYSTKKEKDTKVITITLNQKLVAKLFLDKETKTIISILSTPMQSDALRPIGNFIQFGNGFEKIKEFIIEKNRLYLWRPDTIIINNKKEYSISHQRIEINKNKLNKMNFNGKLLYLTVSQNTTIEAFNNIFKLLNERKPKLIGIGFKRARS